MNAQKNVNSKKEKLVFKWSLIISILLHLFFLAKNIDYDSTVPSQFDKSNEKIQIVLLDHMMKKEKKKRQIVNSQISKLKKNLNKKTLFLSRENNFFKKEMKARVVDSFKKGGRGNSVKKGLISKKISLSNLGPLENPYRRKKSHQRDLQVQGHKILSSSNRGLSQNNDFLEEVPLGDMTQLNTSQFKFFGFYQRIRIKLEQYWGRSLQSKIRSFVRKGRRPAGLQNHITNLYVTLDKKGSIIKIAVKGSSGVSEFDQAAIEAFNEAGPFPNPPSEMLKDGTVIVEWGFVVKV